MTFRPSSLWTVALTGQTVSHGAFSQCWHIIGCDTISGILDRAAAIRREVAVDANPVHLAIADDLLLADDRDVVLRLAGDHARGTAGAGAQVDRHAPLPRDRRAAGSCRARRSWGCGHPSPSSYSAGPPRSSGSAEAVFWYCSKFASRVMSAAAAFQRAVLLRDGEREHAVQLGDAGAHADERLRRRGEREDIDAGACADAADHRAAIAERDGDASCPRGRAR